MHIINATKSPKLTVCSGEDDNARHNGSERVPIENESFVRIIPFTIHAAFEDLVYTMTWSAEHQDSPMIQDRGTGRGLAGKVQ
jgi:hypothetical protein